MSSSKNYQKPTTEDLSNIAELDGFPAFSSSMAGGATVTDKNPHFAGQGSDSEASHDVTTSNVDYGGYGHNTPDLPGARTPASDLDTDEKGSGYSPSPRTWKDI